MTAKKYSLKKNGDLHLSPHFTVREFACHDGSDTVLIDDRLVTLLENIRDKFGKPVRINSAYRTAKYNAKIGGVSNSYHVKGMAADIVAQGVPSKCIAQYAETLGCGGIGWYERKKFVHIDTRKNRVCWKDVGSNVRKTFSECPYTEPSENRKFGDKGAAWVQWHLKKCGAKITIDGKFGAVTKAAVIAFQKAHGLTPDGVVGEKTRLMLRREVV